MQKRDEYAATDGSDQIGGEKGAAQQLEQILAGSLPPLYRRAYRILGNTADAEDAVQDALLAAYTHLDQFRGQAKISTWLTTIVLNCARLELRRRPRHIHVPLDECGEELQPVSVSERLADRRPNPEDQRRESELRERLTHFRQQLSPTLRRTFRLRDRGGFIDPRNRADLGNTERYCESAFGKSSQETPRIDASHSQTAISETAKSIVGFRKSGTSYRRSRVTLMVHLCWTVSVIAQQPWFGNRVALTE